MTQEIPADPPFDRLVRVYRKISGAIQEVEAAAEAKVADLKAQRDAVADAMKRVMREANVTSMKTDHGTAILSTKLRYSSTDWDAFKTFVVENDALDLFEKRIAQGNMQTYLDANPGVVVPGLQANSELTISVRRPSTK